MINRNEQFDELIVYTALFGDYDELLDPPEKYDGCHFICFTNQRHLQSKIWKMRIVEDCDLPFNMMNRRYKILPHIYLPEYKKSLYIDSNICLLKSPKNLSDKYLSQFDFVAPKHFSRNCVYDEAKECIILLKDNKNLIREQIKRYKNLGFPKKFGLSENNILLRNHLNEEVSSLMNSWWEELSKETMRDQLSLPYVIWKHGFPFSFMDESARHPESCISYRQHKSSSNISFLNRLKDSIVFRFRRLFYAWQ